MKPLLVPFVLSGLFFFTTPLPTSRAFAADAPLRTKIRIATAAPSLSYFPIYAAAQKGFFARRGFDVEMIQMNATLTAAALLNRSVDYTIIPSTIATAAARGAAAQAIKAYESVKDAYSRDGVPTAEQSKAYIAMLAATAGLNADLPPGTIFDFSLAAAAVIEIAAKKQ